MKSSALLILVTLIMHSCGKKNSKPVDKIRIGSEPLSSFVESLDLDLDTPDGVGTLLSLEKGTDRVGLCTWFMIDESLALTNSHCIPEALKEDRTIPCGEYLKGRIKIPGGSKVVTCTKLVSASALNRGATRDQDYALVEVNEKIPGFLGKLSRSGVIDGEAIKLYSMNHYQNGYIYSDYVEHECVVRSSDVVLQWRSQASSPLISFRDPVSGISCKTIQGNSGSPVLNARNEIIGVVQAGFKDGVVFTPPEGIRNHLLTSNVSVFTNLRCQKLGDHSLDASIPTTCATEVINSDPDTSEFQGEVERKILEAMEYIMAQQPPMLSFEAKTVQTGNKTTHWIYPEPTCVEDLARWPEASKAEIESYGVLKRDKRITVKLKNFLLRSVIDIDYFGNYQLEVTPQKTSSTRLFRLDKLQDLAEKRQATVVDVEAQSVKSIPMCVL